MPASTMYNAIKDFVSWVLARWRDRLSVEDKKLLVEILQNGNQAYIISTDQTGDFVRVGTHSYFKDGDEMLRIKCLESFKRLCELGCIAHESGILYRLTSSGIEIARK